MHVPWGASSFYLMHHFVVIIRFYFTWYPFLWMILWEWWYHVCAPIFQYKLSIFMHKPWGASLYYLEYSSWSYHNTYLSFGSMFGFIGLLASCVEFLDFIIFLQSLILDIVWIPPSIHHWIRAFDSTHNMRNAHLMEEFSLYWPL